MIPLSPQPATAAELYNARWLFDAADPFEFDITEVQEIVIDISKPAPASE